MSDSARPVASSVRSTRRARAASNGLRRSSVFATGIQHRRGRHVGFRRVDRGRQLNRVDAELVGELNPVLDGAIGIGIAHVPRRQLLERRRQDADLHEFRLERARQLTAHETIVLVAAGLAGSFGG